MTLRLYNTLTRTKEDFKPLDPENVRMYVCGPTVYDYAHIGNARPVIVFDVLFRLLRHLYGEDHVTYVRNITDVDDKINLRALKEYPHLRLNDAIQKVTYKATEQFHLDVRSLGCLTPTEEPRATDNIHQMIDMISELLERNHAYQAAGEVLFDTASMHDYGALSKRELEDQKLGARVKVDSHKRNPTDFVLWKLSSSHEPGWNSPWGRGRPGWHIECSAMSKRYLTEVFDIHGGGIDLIFPHHENEIAQSRCAHGTPFMAKYWMHNGFVQVEGKKMSKSEGNFVTIKQLLRERVFGQRQWSGAVLRMAMLSTHYRQPIDWTVRGLENAEARLERWRAFAGLATSRKVSHDFSVELLSILKDDINSPAAFAKIDEVIEKRPHSEELQFSVFLFMRLVGLKRQQTKVSTLLGKTLALLSSISSLTQQDVKNIAYTVATSDRFADQSLKPEAKLAAALKAVNELVSPITSEMSFNANQQKLQFISEFQLKTPERDVAIQRMITARLEARKAKNWAESDRLRDELAAMGVTIKDNKDGTTTWEIKR